MEDQESRGSGYRLKAVDRIANVLAMFSSGKVAGWPCWCRMPSHPKSRTAMLFTSPIFLFYFLPLVMLAYYLAPAAGRNVLLLVFSLLFYAFGEVFFVAVMLLSIAVNYGAGLAIEAAPLTVRRRYLVAALIANLSLLAFFKYAGFVLENLNLLPGVALAIPDIHLPLGISFFTFQAMSYLVDIYRGTAPVCRDPLRCGLYISLFPQLIAGPIVRYHEIAAQLQERPESSALFVSGVRRFIMGLAKKMLLANPLGELADTVFGMPSSSLDPGLAWCGAIFFGLQIYFDFSAYSDMAIGLGRLFGFRFPENFNYPYSASSMREFWRRWHMSLSRWFRDYLYIPLGGNRFGGARTAFNLVAVFLLCGLWHGASWNFVIWGGIHGLFLALERGGFGTVLGRLWWPLRHFYVLAVVTTAWVFFRLESLPAAWDYVSIMYGFGGAETVPGTLLMLLGREQVLVLLLATLLALPVYPALCIRWAIPMGQRRPLLYAMEHAALFLPLMWLALLSVASSVYNPFIYFRF